MIQIYSNLDIINENFKETKIILDSDSTYNILVEYLSNGDLLNLIVAFDDSNTCIIQSLSFLKNVIEPGTIYYETSKSNDVIRVRINAFYISSMFFIMKNK